MKRRIEVHEYDNQWPKQFEFAKQELEDVFLENIESIHHIGSTSVPGMQAKPTIDILCVVKKNTSITDHYGSMRLLGYECRGECLDAIIPGTPGRHYFPKIINAQHVFHVHVCPVGHPEINDYLCFRNYLRKHPENAKEYGDLKALLAKKYFDNNIAYMRGKDALVKTLIQKAKNQD